MVDIYNPDLYVEAPPHKIFEELRKTSPVFYQEMPGEPGYYAVLRHSDVVRVSREPNLFSASEGGVVLENLDQVGLEQMRNMLLAMDPPRHTNWRGNLAPHFRNRVIGEMADEIRQITKGIFEGVEGEVDLVHDICAHLPSNVVGQIMDIPPEDRPQIHSWAEQQTGGQDPELNPTYNDASDTKNTGAKKDVFVSESVGRASMEMAIYAMGHAKKHRPNLENINGGSANGSANGGEKPGLTELILMAEVDGRSMTDEDFGSFFVQLVTAGNDTTRTMLAAGTLALLQHPEQLEQVRQDASLIPGAVEEILRWANPLHYFRRTATLDTEIAGVKISAGEKVAMIYTSANRDETVFSNPHAFDIHRSPNPHLSFGIGQHFCLGVHLARLEGRIFFEELLSTFSGIQVVGEPRRVRSNLNNSLKELPVKLTP